MTNCQERTGPEEDASSFIVTDGDKLQVYTVPAGECEILGIVSVLPVYF
jgi:hypothetical protein